MQGILGIQSLMDDFIMFAGGINEAYKKALQLLLNAVLNGWVISNKKFNVSTRVEFCGLELEANQDGQVVISPSPDRLAALLDFPSPTTKKEVKSLVGLLNTFSKHIPNVSKLTVKMRELTRDRCAFLWTEDHEEEMNNIRAAAANYLPLRPFCIQFASFIYTDASHQGVGFAFTQVDPAGQEFFVQCGSSACTEAMKNYSCMELELQAIVWAIRKCQVYLMALNEFTVYTDHRDLAGLETRELEPTPNNRLLRNKEFLLSFPLKVKYLPKDQNLIADWLSRKPQPTEVPGLLPRFETGTVALVYEGNPLDKKLLDLIDACNQDDNYCSILQVLN